LLLPCFKW